MICQTAWRRAQPAFPALAAVLVFALLAASLDASAWARFGGFHGFVRPVGGGGFANRFNDGGFGDGGFGSIHQWQGFSGWSRDTAGGDNVAQLQQNRFNEEDTLQQNRYNYARSLQKNSQDYWNNGNGNHYNDHYNGYYANLTLGEDVALGTYLTAPPLAATTIFVAGPPYYYFYDDGTYYAPQGSGYVVVAPPIGAIVPTSPPDCSSASSHGDYLDCGGAYYSAVSGGYKVVTPPIGSTVNQLPEDARKEMVKGISYYVTDGHIFYRPFFSGSAVIYQVVANPL